MNQYNKFVGLLMEYATYVVAIYAIDAAMKFAKDYQATKDRIEVIEMAEGARLLFSQPAAKEPKPARARGTSSSKPRRLQSVQDEPADAAPGDEG